MKKFFTHPRRWLSSLALAGLITTTPTLVQAQDFPDPYCDVTFVFNVEPITIVEFAGIENITDAEIDGTPALEDFTDMTATVLPGFAFEMILDGNTGGEYDNYFFVYADWNQDGDFEDEYEANSAGTIFWSEGDGSAPATSYIPVPTSALPGITRMRVLKVYSDEPMTDPGACSSPFSFGQAEDYSVEVLELDCEFPEITYTVTPDCDENEFSISFDVADMGDATSIEMMEGTTSVHTFTGIGTFGVGPFASGTMHTYTFVHSGSEDCSLIAEDVTYSCPPLNDECSSATVLTVSEGPGCADAVSGTTVAATGTTLEACAGADDDVWYSFEATASVLNVAITPTGGSTSDMMFEFLDVCDGSILLCIDPEVQTITDFEIGTTYYLRVYTYDEDAYADFDICVHTLPEGSFCEEALDVTTIPYTDDGNTGDYSNFYEGGPGFSCSENNYLSGYDVVYSYTAATSGNINVELIPDDFYAGVFIYTSCDNIGLDCADGGVNEDSTDPITVNDFAVTAGETYYFVISTWADPSTINYTFNITNGSTCAAPTSLEATGFTTSTATVAWSSTGTDFDLEWGEEGFTPGSGTTETGISTTFYTIDGLSESTSYSFYVKTICSATDESTWAGPFTFTVPGPGWTCENPLEVTDLPYTTDDNTANYGDAFTGSPGATGCGSTFSYLSGYDVVYSYTPSASGSINAELIPEDIYAGLFIYTSCDDIGVACEAGGVNEESFDPINIDDFVVTAGETYYFVISTWADPISTAYTFNITENVVAVTGIDVTTVDFVPAIINVDGGTLAMASSITPVTADQSVNWSIVSAGGTATISTTGVVTAVANGIVYAKATSVADASYKDSMLITISNQEIAATSVDVTVESGAAAIINTAGGTLQMAATVLPSTADQDVNWSIVEGTGEATISAAGLVTAGGNGTVWAKAVVASDGTLTDSLMITITNQETGLDELIKSLGFSIHPNPTNNAVNLAMTSNHPDLSIVVTDINGRHLAAYTVPANGLNKGMKIDLDKFASGIYLVTISGKDIRLSSKIVKH